ncbi:MAG: alpha-L-fucosidase [Armatimonadetes bacterium]|nr:alpha-L-fucosidase [Armatimonadota bacterium]
MSDMLSIAKGPYDPTFESLRNFECPDWFRDAKLAFWSHWGPQSVPMFGDWYARNMYVEGSDQYRYHWRVYGHPSKFGYKDIVKLWKAEKFDPDALMGLFVDAGARYFVGQAVHHDNFDNWNSAHNKWNSVNIGPKKDICKMWQEAAKAKGLPFGLTEHLGASFNWFETNKRCDKVGPYAGVPYDGNDPAYEDLYYPNRDYSIDRSGEWQWYTSNSWFHQHWFNRIIDLIDKFQPDLLYSDGVLPFGEFGLAMVAHLYNTSAALHGVNRAVYNQKDSNPDVYTVGVLDIERGQRDDIAEHPWQTDTSIGDWYYNVKDVYKTPQHVIEMLIDIVSKNGNLVMNIPQLPDGSLDDECAYLLKTMAKWMKVNAEGIHGTRPWTKSSEGSSAAAAGAFKEEAVVWKPADFRFTQKGNTLYAYQMRRPECNQSVIRSFAKGRTPKILNVQLLGCGKVAFEQTVEGLEITLPNAWKTDMPQCFAVETAG